MQFSSEDIHMKWSVEEIDKLFFLRKDLSDLSDRERDSLLSKVNVVGLKEIRTDTVHILLCLMHEAREVDQTRFLREVFLPWHALQLKTKPHLERIGEELCRICDFESGSVQEATHTVNVYRNIVSDLFDPFLTLVVASTQFTENRFTSLEQADLGQCERNKFEYLFARMNVLFKGKPNFLSGYDPIVRNAISHTGAHGVSYGDNEIVFKNIKRGSTVTVETVTWSFTELQCRVIQLLECVQSIAVAAEVFGLDCSEVIINDFDTYLQFLHHAVPMERKDEMHERQNQLLVQIRDSSELPLEQKHEVLTQSLFHNYDLRNMPCRGVSFSNNNAAVMVEVPSIAVDLNDNEQIQERLCDLCRYAIISRSVFGRMYDPVHVVETDDTRKKQQLAGQITGNDLDEYILKRAGLLDLLNDSNWTMMGQPLTIQVDFKAVEEIEQASPNLPFPRKQRPSS